jgi:hypothetical protein
MVGPRRAPVVAALLCLAFLAASEPAYACEPATNGTLEVGDDHAGEAPSGIAGPSATVHRGNGPDSTGCGQSSSTSCDDMGSVILNFEVATDVDSTRESVGYRVEVIAGTAPGSSFSQSTDQVLVPSFHSDDEHIGTLYFHWDDGATDDQEGIDFTITLTPVDANGNEGPTSDPIRIQDEGSSSGCAVGEPQARPSWASAAAILSAVAMAFARRLKRSRRA